MDLRHDVVLEAPASVAWQVLGEAFGDVADWSTTLASSHLIGALDVGAARVCENRGFGPFPASQITETLTRFDRQTMSFAYDATEGLPAFVRKAENRWTIEPVGPHQCRVRIHATVTLAWWARPFGFLLPSLMRRDLDRFLEELRHQVEHGVPHPRKQALA